MSDLASAPSGPPVPAAPTPRPRTSPAPPPPSRPDKPVEPGPAAAEQPPVVPSGTAAGTLLAGRYRLGTRVGSDTAAGAEFWRAEDTVLQRDVGITVLRRLAPDSSVNGGDAGAARAGEMVVRALRLGSFEHPGCARLLDVLAPEGSRIPDDVLGAAVTEWVPGRSLAELVADGMIRPLAAARAVVPLAGAAEAAHRHGLVLGVDHPQRIRITPDGRAQLSFVLPRPTVTPADDVRGLGAILYTLLTSRWPLSRTDAARAGLAPAERTSRGAHVAPSRLRLGVPIELDTLVQGTLGPSDELGHVRTAAAVQLLLNEVVAEDDRIALFPPAHDGLPSSPGDVWQDGNRPPPDPNPKRRRNLAIGLTALGLAVLVVLGYLGIGLTSMFVGVGRPAIVVADKPPDTPSGPGNVALEPAEDEPPPPSSGGPAVAAGVEVYDRSGDRDNSGRVSRVIDGNPSSGWNTFTYKQQFPSLKPGVGIMVSFASAVQLAELTIDSPSPGTVVQVRSAPSAESSFPETTQLAEVTLGGGPTAVSLNGSQPVTHVLVWIVKLGGNDGENRTEINELQFQRA